MSLDSTALGHSIGVQKRFHVGRLVHDAYVFLAMSGVFILVFVAYSKGNLVHASWIAALTAGWSSSWSP